MAVKDKTGSSDPFARLTFAEQKFDTRVRTPLNFNVIFFFFIFCLFLCVNCKLPSHNFTHKCVAKSILNYMCLRWSVRMSVWESSQRTWRAFHIFLICWRWFSSDTAFINISSYGTARRNCHFFYLILAFKQYNFYEMSWKIITVLMGAPISHEKWHWPFRNGLLKGAGHVW